MKRKIIISVILILIATVTISYFFILKKENKELKTQKEVELEKFQLFLYQNSEIIKKEVYLSKEVNELKKIEKVLENFINDLGNSSNKTKLIGLFKDKENKIYLDFSSNFSVPMDAKEEFYLLKSLFLTLKINFIWISDVKILISSSERETLSGHILINSLNESLEEN